MHITLIHQSWQLRRRLLSPLIHREVMKIGKYTASNYTEVSDDVGTCHYVGI